MGAAVVPLSPPGNGPCGRGKRAAALCCFTETGTGQAWDKDGMSPCRDRWKTPDANPQYEPDSDSDSGSGVNAVKMPPKAAREPDTEVATAEASFCKVELESEVAGARPIETNDHSGEWMDTQPKYGNDRD